MSNFGYHSILSLSWIVISYYSGYYEVYRFTKEITILGKLIKQFIFISLITFAYVGYKYKYVTPDEVWIYIIFSFISVGFIKFSIFFLLKKYRLLYGGNLRNVIILGSGKDVDELKLFFTTKPNYGYNLMQVFSLKINKKEEIKACYEFVTKNNVDEIYGSLNTLNSTDLQGLIHFADNNLKTIKLLPDSKNRMLRNLAVEYYGYVPVISLRTIPLDKIINKRFKHFFDVVFSLLVILLLLSWLAPLIAIIIKMESKGPVFFKQRRNGLNYKEFNCYKFRSMRLNSKADLEQVQKNDPRVTNFGKILRKFSLDELPQFFNVLLGDMSVVGPRPHTLPMNDTFRTQIERYNSRHKIKPGITGLAQVRGYRGEIENSFQIRSRVRLDYFYINNWSFLLDLEIMVKTVYELLFNRENAY